MTDFTHDLKTTIGRLTARGKGILAADESTATISKRFEAVGIATTEDNRRAYRDLLMTTPNINAFIAGVILFEETLNQQNLQSTPFPQALADAGILAGIKVDKGLIPLQNTNNEMVTQGLDGLPQRLAEYKAKGASFAKWRAVYTISANTPSCLAIAANAEVLARYAACCQEAGIVPMVEPEVLIDGEHTIEQCEIASRAVLHAVFNALFAHKVNLAYTVLKPSMVINGKACRMPASVQAVADATLRVLRATVPATVPTINFLSGGQTPQQATAHLNAMNAKGSLPWNVSFSYARALQDNCMKAWAGQSTAVAAAQQAFYQRAKLNSLAALGNYEEAMEK